MKNKQVPLLALGTVHGGPDEANGLADLIIAGQTLRIRAKSRVKRYIEPGGRYLIGWIHDDYADTITVLIRNPSMMQVFRMQERQEQGSLPTRDVWKQNKPRKRPATKSRYEFVEVQEGSES